MSFLIPVALLAVPTDITAGEPDCLPDASGYLSARLRGDIELDVDWRQPLLRCTGMPRPDGRGMRLRFSATLPDGSTLAFLFAPPELAAGADARAVPVNVTVLQEAAGLIYGTRGDGRCLLDEVTQRPLAGPDEARQSWVVEARGFCTEPARALDDSGSVLLTRFDFRGRVDLPAERKAGRPAGEPAP